MVVSDVAVGSVEVEVMLVASANLKRYNFKIFIESLKIHSSRVAYEGESSTEPRLRLNPGFN